MFRVLVVEDGNQEVGFVESAIQHPELQVRTLSSVSEALTLLSKDGLSAVDMVILDVGMRVEPALGFLNQIRGHAHLGELPVVFVTQADQLTCKITAFSLGADDYLIKPVDALELKCRVEMRLKRFDHHRKKVDVIRRGDLVLDMAMMRACVIGGGREFELDLTHKEFKILTVLAKNESQVYSRSRLMRAVWGESVHVLDRTVDSHICGLRKKLGDLAHYVESIPSSGYRFRSPTL